jgi:hypothetical protein
MSVGVGFGDRSAVGSTVGCVFFKDKVQAKKYLSKLVLVIFLQIGLRLGRHLDVRLVVVLVQR